MDSDTSNFDLFLSLTEDEGNITGVLTFKTDLFNSSTITQMLENFQTLLKSLVANPNQRLSDLPSLIKTQSHQTENKSGSLSKTKQELEKTFVAPRDEIEFQLTNIWEKVLGIQPIGIRDNFFDLGGNSLKAIRLVTEIDQAFKQQFSLAALSQLSTVEKLAKTFGQGKATGSARIAQQQPKLLNPEESTTNDSPIVPQLSQAEYLSLLASTISKKRILVPESLLLLEQASEPNSQTPLFFVYLLGDLGKYFAPEQTVYSLTVWTKVESPSTFIKALAAHYVKEIQTVQPHDPYLIGGYCFGGWLALEIAQQLQVKDQKVAQLILVQTQGPAPVYRRYQPILLRFGYDFLLRFVTHWRYLRVLDSKKQLKYIVERVKLVLGRVTSKFSQNFKDERDAQTHISSDDNSDDNYEAEVLKSFGLASLNYIPQPYSGKVALFFASEGRFRSFLFPKGGWGKLLKGQVDVHLVPGNHTGLLKEPHVRVLAEKLKVYLSPGT